MFTSIAEMVKSLADCGRGFANKIKTDKEHQAETVVIKDREKLKRACDITEQSFWLMREYFATDSQFLMWLEHLIYSELNKDEKRLFKRFYKEKLKLKKKIEKLQKEFEKVD